MDRAVLRRLVTFSGASPGTIYIKEGKTNLRQRINGYNNAARYQPWVILADLDHDHDCAGGFRNIWLPTPAEYMCFRVAVREVEAWLLADHQALSQFLRVPASRVPVHPDSVDSPKRELVMLANRSRVQDIRRDMVPRPGSGRIVGPAYTSRTIEFIRQQWRPDVACRRSPSLERCLTRIRELISTWKASR